MSATWTSLLTKTGTGDTLDCTWVMAPTSLSFDAAGEAKTSDLTSCLLCTWQAVNRNSDAWLSFDPVTGDTLATITITTTANTGVERTGYVDIQNLVPSTAYPTPGTVVATVTCVQAAGTPASYTVSPTTIDQAWGVFPPLSPPSCVDVSSAIQLPLVWDAPSSSWKSGSADPGAAQIPDGGPPWTLTIYTGPGMGYDTSTWTKATGTTPAGTYTRTGDGAACTPTTVTVS